MAISYDIYTLFFLFIVYSSFGWLMEVICKLIEKHRFINRGFLIGPICPIYGWGGIFTLILLDKYKSNIFILFIMTILIASILEYVTSFLMEKIFKTRWWDYSTRRFNINGRICLETMIPFGIMGLISIYIVNPFLINIVNLINGKIFKICLIIIFIIYIIDNIVSSKVIFSFRKTITNIERDSTEEITRKVKTVFESKGIFSRRLVHAFPNMINPIEYLVKLRERLNKEIENIMKKN